MRCLLLRLIDRLRLIDEDGVGVVGGRGGPGGGPGGEEPEGVVIGSAGGGAVGGEGQTGLGGQLYITDGVGLVCTRDGGVVRVSAGETVRCPPGEEHWHGATGTTLMAHIAMVVGNGNGDGTTWLEPVTDQQYTDALAAIGH